MNKPHFSFKSSLSDPETLDRIAYFMVFVSSAFVINNGITDFKLFTLCFIALVAGYFCNRPRHAQPKVQNTITIFKSSVLYFIQLLGVVIFLSLTEDIAATAVFLTALCCSRLRMFIQPKNIVLVISLFVLLIVEMSCLGILGAFTQLQTWEHVRGTYYIVSVFGIATAFFYFAAQILKSESMLKEAGWSMLKTVKNKQQQEILIPGSILRVYIISVFIGSMLPVSLAFFDVLPKPFLIYACALYLGLKLVEKLPGYTADIETMIIKTLKISSLIGVFNILIGVVAR